MNNHGLIAGVFALTAAEVLRENVGRRNAYAKLAAEIERDDAAYIAAAQAKRERRVAKALKAQGGGA